MDILKNGDIIQYNSRIALQKTRFPHPNKSDLLKAQSSLEAELGLEARSPIQALEAGHIPQATPPGSRSWPVTPWLTGPTHCQTHSPFSLSHWCQLLLASLHGQTNPSLVQHTPHFLALKARISRQGKGLAKFLR